MALFEKFSLFDYLKGEKELANLSQGKDLQASSPEALALLTALSFKEKPRKIFVLFPTIYEAESFSQFLGDYLEEDQNYIFPYDEIFRASAIGVSPEMLEERLLGIASTFDKKPSILVSHVSAALLPLVSHKNYASSLLTLHCGDMVLMKEVIEKLSKVVYLYVDKVTNANQFSYRGGILDVYDAAYSDPVRIEFFGDEVDDIRFFKVSDELSYRHDKEVTLHPASLIFFTESEKEEGKKLCESLKSSAQTTALERLAYDERIQLLHQLEDELEQGFLAPVDSRFYPLFGKNPESLFAYLDGYQKLIFHPQDCQEEEKSDKKREKEYFDEAIEQGASLYGEGAYLPHLPTLEDAHSVTDGDNAFLIRENSFKSLSYSESKQMLQEYQNEDYKIRIVLPEPNLSNYDNYLQDASIPHTLYPTHSPLMLIEGRITHGFEIPSQKHVYLSAKEIYGVSDQKTRFLSRYKEAKIIRKYEDLKSGDYVVHEVHGVGKFLGVVTMNGLEYLKIQYAGDAVFYLPLSQYRLIRKYASREGYTPALDRMGGSTWSRKKAKIRSKISYLADQLLSLYAEREKKPGYAFSREDVLEAEFQKDFPYPYTESQKRAIADVKADMESPHPMDRLIAGDVGFGKTEIAFNAAFKAMLDHKQVIFLCPTTILSNQHYQVALKRFRNYGVRIEVYNRFVPKEKQKEIQEDLKAGKIDMVIGTHALLSDKIVFQNLGLLIVDEEQKFGVAHKEKIKVKARNVDTLTLTATPIPRTMQMSLLGMRNTSLLSDAPLNRMPVKTYVAKQDDELIQEVIEKELARHGQVYYLHNNIASIQGVADKLAKRFKGYHIAYIHARMSEEDIESIMNRFYQAEIDVLVCTSIIESGLDIPNVNTIIVENADHFGLAQLYQIKGRVGRSDRLAYAYFFFRDADRVTDEGKKRLKALKDFTELGSGYKIAMQDLNIRGAGDILGSQQAGFVDTLGYDAYMDLLSTVLKEKKLMTKALAEEEHPPFELSFSLDAHIPEDYGSESQRITMYRELSDCKNDEDLQHYSRKLRDVYGPYPEEVSNLITKRKIEIYLNSGIVSGFVEALGSYTITMSNAFSSARQIYVKVEEYLSPMVVKMRFRVTSNHLFEFTLTKTKEYLADLLFMMENLDKAYQETISLTKTLTSSTSN